MKVAYLEEHKYHTISHKKDPPKTILQTTFIFTAAC